MSVYSFEGMVSKQEGFGGGLIDNPDISGVVNEIHVGKSKIWFPREFGRIFGQEELRSISEKPPDGYVHYRFLIEPFPRHEPWVLVVCATQNTFRTQFVTLLAVTPM